MMRCVYTTPQTHTHHTTHAEVIFRHMRFDIPIQKHKNKEKKPDNSTICFQN